MDIPLMLQVALRASLLYGLLLIITRLLGKRKLGIHSAFDLIVAIVLADLAGQAIFGTISLEYVVFAMLVVAGWHYAGHYLAARHDRIRQLLAQEPRVLVRDGEIDTEALWAEQLPVAELHSLLRRQGVEELADVKLAYLEPNGQVSVVYHEWAQTVRKAELAPELEREV